MSSAEQFDSFRYSEQSETVFFITVHRTVAHKTLSIILNFYCLTKFSVFSMFILTIFASACLRILFKLS